MGLARATALKNALLAAAVGGACLATASPVHAQATTGSFVLNAAVAQSCDVFAVPLMFGTLPQAFFIVDRSSVIRVTCTPNTVFEVAIDDGQNFGSGSRRMRRTGGGGARYLRYELYSNAAMTRRWGATPASIVTRTAPADGSSVVLPVYGRTSGNVGAGPYVDLVTISVSF